MSSGIIGRDFLDVAVDVDAAIRAVDEVAR